MPVVNNMTIKVGGEAGQGVESSGAGFAKALARAGLWIYGLQDYMSRIRGGHNFYQIRISEHEVWSFRDQVHMLLPFTVEAVERHWEEIVPGGAILYDVGIKFDEAPLRERGIKLFALPLMKIAEQQGGSRVMMNTAALGAVAGLTDFDFEYIADIIESNFGRKGGTVAESNLKVARYAYDLGRDQFASQYDWKLQARPGTQRMLMNGNQAIALGAMAGGCRFISGYPMTPATTILEYMSSKADRFGIVTKQTEDEIAGVLTAIGAAHAGVRAMTATSGGGFCLMTEGLGFAGCTETPIVVVDSQRAGPSTGLPTRTEQGDLQFVLYASHGEFPRIVLAPGTIEECFYSGARAFNLAEKYQCPVIIMQDLTQSNAIRTIPKDRLDFSAVHIERGALLTAEDLDRLDGDYRRHLVTPDGISPRATPGHPKSVYVTTGDEHTEYGFITEESDVRRAQMEKRMRKLDTAAKEIRLPVRYGPQEADLTFVGWGSTYGALREAVDLLNADGPKANLIHFMELWPHEWSRVRELLDEARTLVLVEQNYTGQLGQVIRTYTGKTMDKTILKYDGRPISADEIVAGVRGELRAEVKSMLDVKLFNSTEKSTWCPGCGDFGILTAVKQSLAMQEIHPHECIIVSGIGCGSKLPHYIRANGFNILHGRSLPVATGLKLANHDLKVIVTTGDGDGYGIGMGHLVHTMRRNLDIVHIVEDNQTYGLTKGQYSPTSERGYVTTTSPDGAIEYAVNPMAIAIAAGATFVARGFSSEPKHLAELIGQAIHHKGYALVDVLQPCVTYNKVNTNAWYKSHVYHLEQEEGYDPTNKAEAFARAQEWGEKIPVGVLFRDESRPTYESQVSVLDRGPLVKQPVDGHSLEEWESIKQEFV